MGQVLPLSHDYFQVNVERSDIWAQIFCEDEKNIDTLQLLYDFSAQDEAFTDIADFIYSRGKCIRGDNNLSKSILTFTNHMKKSNLFTQEDILDVKQALKKLLISGYKYIESQQEVILKQVLTTLEEDRNNLQKLYENIGHDEVIRH